VTASLASGLFFAAVKNKISGFFQEIIPHSLKYFVYLPYMQHFK